MPSGALPVGLGFDDFLATPPDLPPPDFPPLEDFPLTDLVGAIVVRWTNFSVVEETSEWVLELFLKSREPVGI